MHIHTVFFWLWKSSSAQDRKQFEEGLDNLTKDTNILMRKIGKPAATNREVIDSSYDYGVVLHFENQAAHDAYQAGEPHQRFLSDCMRLWNRVQVYDIQVDSGI